MARKIVAVALLTQAALDRLGPAFDRAFPVEETPCFSNLLRAIDAADRDLQRSSENHQKQSPARKLGDPNAHSGL